MICLSQKQQESAEKLTRYLLSKYPAESFSGIMKRLYDITFEQFPERQKAETQGIAIVAYVASTINSIISNHEDDFRDILLNILGKEKTFDPTEVLELQYESNIRKLVGIKDSKIERPVSTVDVVTAQVLERKIVNSFEEKFRTFEFPSTTQRSPIGTPSVRMNGVVSDTGAVIPLFRPSQVSVGSIPQVGIEKTQNAQLIPGGQFDEALAYGTLADAAVRYFISNKNSSYEEIKDMLKEDNIFLNAFSAYTLRSNKGDVNPKSDKLFNTYLDLFLEDIVLTVATLENTYKDYYLTDLKTYDKGFKLYNKQLQVFGEPDIMAINPKDNTFRIIDLKTAGNPLSESKINQYNIQISLYDYIIEQATKLISENKVDILFVRKDIREGSTTLLSKTGRRRAIIEDIDVISSQRVSLEEIKKIINDYNENFFKSFQKVVDTPVVVARFQSPLEKDPSILMRSLLRNKKTYVSKIKKDPPLSQIFSSDEPISTNTSIELGAKWLEERFPELAGRGIQIVPHLLNNTGGQFYLDMIILARKSNEGVAYHEGWHRFSQLYLTKKEKEFIYSRIRKLSTSFTTRDGRKVNTITAALLDIEEYLAEQFKDFALNPKEYDFTKLDNELNTEVKNIFQKIWDFLKSLFKTHNNINSFENLFKSLYFGTYYRGNYSINNNVFSTLNSFFRDSNGKPVTDDKTFLRYRDYMDFVISNTMIAEDETIYSLISKEEDGISIIRQIIEDSISNLEEDLRFEIDNNTATEIQKLQHSHTLDIKNNLVRFMAAYFRTTKFEALKEFVSINKETVLKQIEKEVYSNLEIEEEEGEDLAEDYGNASEIEYDRVGNEKKATELARAELKDFFNGLVELDIEGTETIMPFKIVNGKPTYKSVLEYAKFDAFGLPKTLNRTKVFYKTLEVLSGKLTEDLVIKELNNPDNYEKFPELQLIRNRLLGAAYEEGTVTEGIIPKLERLSLVLESGNATNEEIQQHLELKSFLEHFMHVMTLPKVEYESAIYDMARDTASTLDEGDSSKQFNPVQSRPNTEAVISNIINTFARGFQDAARNEHKRLKSIGKEMPTIYQALMLNNSEYYERVKEFKYFYDPVLKVYHFNPEYAKAMYSSRVIKGNDIDIAEMRSFFELYGIQLSSAAYEKSKDRLIGIYNTLIRITAEYANETKQMIVNALTVDTLARYNIGNIEAYGEILLKIKELEEQNLPTSQYDTQKLDLERKLSILASKSYPKSPVSELLYKGQDYRDRKGDYQKKIFARNLPTFINLADIQKQYKEHFSSGSMLVKDGTEFSYFQPNQMLLISSLIENGEINTFSDFDKYNELYHLNPIRNHQLKSSWMMRMLFDENGNKIPNRKLKISVLSQITINKETGEKEEKKISEIKKDEKMLMDFLLVTREGSSEIRRLETSNTTYRISIVDDKTGTSRYMKPTTIGRQGFASESFQIQIKDYIESAMFMYNHHKDKADKNNILGVFEEMLGPSISKSLKEEINKYPKDHDFSSFFNEIEKSNPTLYNDVSKRIVDFFEMMTFGNEQGIDELFNEPSYAKMFVDNSSSKTRDMIKTFMSYSTKVIGPDIIRSGLQNFSSIKTLVEDPIFKTQLREFIAIDFINAMEDSLWFFGDYSYFKDPIKRRKIIGNNGTIAMSGSIIARAEKAQRQSKSLTKLYREFNKKPMVDKNYKNVRKFIMKDPKITLYHSKHVIDELYDYYNQKGTPKTKDQIREEKKNTIDSFTNVELADAAAYISLDTFRMMRMKEKMWSRADEKEYDRQLLILKWKLLGGSKEALDEFTPSEFLLIVGKPKSAFNIAKFATTGPIFSEGLSPFKPVFDKMGLKVLLPETDWETKRNIFEHMLNNDIDYAVYNSGSKGYIESTSNVWDESKGFRQSSEEIAPFTEHAGGFFKYQQNTAAVKDDAVLANQLRGIFFEVMVLNPGLRKGEAKMEEKYNKFINSISKILQIQGDNSLSSLGLDSDGNFIVDSNGTTVGKRIFAEKIKEKLISIGDVDLSVLEHLNVDNDNNFVNFLESLSTYRDIYNIVSGILDDSFRKIKLNGSKLYQTPELGSIKFTNKQANKNASLGLKWHGFERNEKGEIIGTLPCECKLPFKETFKPLLQLRTLDGEKIEGRTYADSLKRLNKALKDPKWVEKNKESLTFVGVRIPLQDMNFTSHLIVAEFYPESEGDFIIVPPEFYKQMGADNDIDTLTATFKELDRYTGKPIKTPKESYSEITERIATLETQKGNFVKQAHQAELESQSEVNQLINDFQEIYLSNRLTIDDMKRDFSFIKLDRTFVTLEGRNNPKSFLNRILRYKMDPELISKVYEILDRENSTIEQDPKLNPVLKELKELYKKKANYIKGLTNDTMDSILSFLKLPESYQYVTETDSMEPIENIAKKALSLLGNIPENEVKLNPIVSALYGISYTHNIGNHENNFQIRSILGSYVKFRRLLTTLANNDIVINKKYKSTSIENLYLESQGKLLNKKSYDRIIRNPLSKSITSEAGYYKTDLIDENGDRITKNMSMLVSTLLDLFKNMDTYPSLGVSWTNVKPFIFLTTLRIPIEKSILFFNNPIVSLVEKTQSDLGSEYQLRHALVKTSQDIFNNDIHPAQLDLSKDSPKDPTYDWNDESGRKGKQNQRRHAQAGEKFLAKKYENLGQDFKIDYDKMNKFTLEYNIYKNQNLENSETENLKEFLQLNPEYSEFAKDILAYYSTLLEDGDNFYGMIIRKLDRDSTKYNNIAIVAETDKTEQALKYSEMVNPDFHNKIKTNSPFTPFYNDDKVLNVIKSILPELFKVNPIFGEEIIKTISRLTTQVFSKNSEEKRKIETIIVSDLIEFIYKNFLVLTVKQGDQTISNFLYEFFETDIHPQMKEAKIRNLASSKHVNRKELKDEVDISDNQDVLFDINIFSTQLELIQAKYYELRELKLFKLLDSRRVAPHFYKEEVEQEVDEDAFNDDPSVVKKQDDWFDDNDPLSMSQKKSNKKTKPVSISEIYNILHSSYISANLAVEPSMKSIEEVEMREEFTKFLNFDISELPFLPITEDRKEIYTNENNIAEIREFARLLGYYALVQSSHLNRAKGTFSNIVPQEILIDVIETSLNNFHETTKARLWKEQDYRELLYRFEQMFKEQNAELGFKPENDVESYKKTYTGKLYSKFATEYKKLQDIKNSLLKEAIANNNSVEGVNNFGIDISELQNCKL